MKLNDASEHLIQAGGKKLRPSLVLLSCEAVGGRAEDALKTAAAMELIHKFSLIHDDIMDKDEMRRGVPSVHVLWGEPMAILVGDTLFSKAFETILKTKPDNFISDTTTVTTNNTTTQPQTTTKTSNIISASTAIAIVKRLPHNPKDKFVAKYVQNGNHPYYMITVYGGDPNIPFTYGQAIGGEKIDAQTGESLGGMG